MLDVEERKPQERLHERFSQVLELLQRHRLIEERVARQGSDNQERVEELVQQQHLAELQQKLTNYTRLILPTFLKLCL